MTPKKGTPIPESKKKVVKELAELVKNKKTILMASIKDIPASQFQEIGKKLRGKAIVKVPKKSLIFRALDESKKSGSEELKKNFENSVAILFSDLDSFELAGELIQNKSPAKAKAGQEAPEDIEVEEGPTELVPGPAISELGALGIQIQIEKGKIHIKESKVIVKKGKKISAAAADLMGKLDIKPFSIGFSPLCSLDISNGKFYGELKIDREETLANLKEAHGRALPFAVEIGYNSKDTISHLLAKAAAHGNKINRIFTGEPEPEVEAAPVEEKEEAPKEEKKEEKAPAAAGLGALFG